MFSIVIWVLTDPSTNDCYPQTTWGDLASYNLLSTCLKRQKRMKIKRDVKLGQSAQVQGLRNGGSTPVLQEDLQYVVFLP